MSTTEPISFTCEQDEAWARIPGMDYDELLGEYLNPPEVIKTGIPMLDYHLAGGMTPGVYVIAAKPGGGKSALALQIALNTALAGRRALVVSAEMTVSQCAARICSNLSYRPGLPGRDFKAFKWSDWEKMGERGIEDGREALRYLVERVPGLKVIDPADLGDGTLDALSPVLEDAAGAGTSLVVVDYLQRMPSAPDLAGDEFSRIGATSTYFMDAAKNLGLRILLITSTGRAARKGAGNLDSATAGMGSSSIEYDATACIGLSPEKQSNGEVLVSLTVDKARRGITTGKGDSIDLRFMGAYNYFEPWARAIGWDEEIVPAQEHGKDGE